MQATRGDSGRPRAGLWLGSTVAILALVIGLIWVAGGFEVRTDTRTIVAPATTIATGPYTFTFESATVQKKKNYSDELLWEVVVAGSGRVTGDEAMAPSSLSWFFTAREPASGLAEEPESQQFGPADRTGGGGDFFTPGLPPVPYRLVFQFPIDIDQPAAIQLGVWELEYRDTSLLQTGDQSWARADRYYRYDGLPMKRIADQLD